MDAEIFVVDNNSTDGSCDYFKGRFEKVNFIWQHENVGFSKANNVAVKLARGNKILFLNPDTLLPEDCLEKCVNFFDAQINAGALGVRMIDGSGQFLRESKRGFPSPSTSIFKLLRLVDLFPKSKLFSKYYLGNLDEHQNHQVDVLSGAFMMVDKNVLNTTGSFDEDFFMYAEDIDLSYRIQKAGFKNFYFSESSILHFKGESSTKENLQYINRFYGAMALFVKKHYGNSGANFYSLIIEITIAIKTISTSIINFIKLLFASLKKKEIGLNKVSKTVIIADTIQFNIIVAALSAAGKEFEIVGRLALNKNESNCIGDISQLSILIKTHAVKEIIFCSNGLSISQIINCMQQLPKFINCWFHAASTNSIVGSSNKNATGYFIALHK